MYSEVSLVLCLSPVSLLHRSFLPVLSRAVGRSKFFALKEARKLYLSPPESRSLLLYVQSRPGPGLVVGHREG